MYTNMPKHPQSSSQL